MFAIRGGLLLRRGVRRLRCRVIKVISDAVYQVSYNHRERIGDNEVL
jgi:hypothetical protein